MLRQAGHLFRLARAGLVLARHDALPGPGDVVELPLPARTAIRLAGLGRRAPAAPGPNSPVVTAITALGPSYIKLGQFLATRPDIVGAKRAGELAELQDRLPPFDQEAARAEVAAGLGAPLEQLFEHFGPPVAAASIAQVHKATTREAQGPGRSVAVKILRPGIERRFQTDLDSFFFAARLMERWHPPSRRLRPVDAVATLAHSVKIEMDLRMEAAAISEMTANIANDPGFRVPQVDWARTSRRVLTTEWIDGIPLSAVPQLAAAGFDRNSSPTRSFSRS
jgi:ubiquinone biosynthesis protein